MKHWGPPGSYGPEEMAWLWGLQPEKHLKKFLEDSNLAVEMEDFLFANEFSGEKYHAVKLLQSKLVNGALRLGNGTWPGIDNQVFLVSHLFLESKF